MKKHLISLISTAVFALPLTAITTDAVAQNAAQDPFKPATQSRPLEKKSAHKVGAKAKAKTHASAKAKAKKTKLHAGAASKAKAHASAKSKSKASKVAKHKAKKPHLAQAKSKHSKSKTYKTV
jgi:hypothetical protein